MIIGNFPGNHRSSPLQQLGTAAHGGDSLIPRGRMDFDFSLCDAYALSTSYVQAPATQAAMSDVGTAIVDCSAHRNTAECSNLPTDNSGSLEKAADCQTELQNIVTDMVTMNLNISTSSSTITHDGASQSDQEPKNIVINTGKNNETPPPISTAEEDASLHPQIQNDLCTDNLIGESDPAVTLNNAAEDVDLGIKNAGTSLEQTYLEAKLTVETEPKTRSSISNPERANQGVSTSTTFTDTDTSEARSFHQIQGPGEVYNANFGASESCGEQVNESSSFPNLSTDKPFAEGAEEKAPRTTCLTGVSYLKLEKSYQVHISVNDKSYYLARYQLSTDAGYAYDQAVARLSKTKLISGTGVRKVNFASYEDYKKTRIEELNESGIAVNEKNSLTEVSSRTQRCIEALIEKIGSAKIYGRNQPPTGNGIVYPIPQQRDVQADVDTAGMLHLIGSENPQLHPTDYTANDDPLFHLPAPWESPHTAPSIANERMHLPTSYVPPSNREQLHRPVLYATGSHTVPSYHYHYNRYTYHSNQRDAQDQSADDELWRAFLDHFQYKGVSYHKPTSKLCSQIYHNGKMYNLGYYCLAADAAFAYDSAISLKGLHEKRNFASSKCYVHARAREMGSAPEDIVGSLKDIVQTVKKHLHQSGLSCQGDQQPKNTLEQNKSPFPDDAEETPTSDNADMHHSKSIHDETEDTGATIIDYVGVSFHQESSRYQVTLLHGKENQYLGHYILRADAAFAFDKASEAFKVPGQRKKNFETTEDYEIAREIELFSLGVTEEVAGSVDDIQAKIQMHISKLQQATVDATRKALLQSRRFIGVTYVKVWNMYQVQICVDSKQYHVGSCILAADAAFAYDKVAKALKSIRPVKKGCGWRINFASFKEYKKERAQEIDESGIICPISLGEAIAVSKKFAVALIEKVESISDGFKSVEELDFAAHANTDAKVDEAKKTSASNNLPAHRLFSKSQSTPLTEKSSSSSTGIVVDEATKKAVLQSGRFVGVSCNRVQNVYQARIFVERKQYHVESCRLAVDAAFAYDKAVEAMKSITPAKKGRRWSTNFASIEVYEKERAREIDKPGINVSIDEAIATAQKNAVDLIKKVESARRASHTSNLEGKAQESSESSPQAESTKKTSEFRGVSYCSSALKFLAQITHNKTKCTLGYYDLEADAAYAYDAAVKAWKPPYWKNNFSSRESYEMARSTELNQMNESKNNIDSVDKVDAEIKKKLNQFATKKHGSKSDAHPDSITTSNLADEAKHRTVVALSSTVAGSNYPANRATNAPEESFSRAFEHAPNCDQVPEHESRSDQTEGIKRSFDSGEDMEPPSKKRRLFRLEASIGNKTVMCSVKPTPVLEAELDGKSIACNIAFYDKPDVIVDEVVEKATALPSSFVKATKNFSGSCYRKREKLYTSQIGFGSKIYYLGDYQLSADAGYAYDQAVARLGKAKLVDISEKKVNFASYEVYEKTRIEELNESGIAVNEKNSLTEVSSRAQRCIDALMEKIESAKKLDQNKEFNEVQSDKKSALAGDSNTTSQGPKRMNGSESDVHPDSITTTNPSYKSTIVENASNCDETVGQECHNEQSERTKAPPDMYSDSYALTENIEVTVVAPIEEAASHAFKQSQNHKVAAKDRSMDNRNTNVTRTGHVECPALNIDIHKQYNVVTQKKSVPVTPGEASISDFVITGGGRKRTRKAKKRKPHCSNSPTQHPSAISELNTRTELLKKKWGHLFSDQDWLQPSYTEVYESGIGLMLNDLKQTRVEFRSGTGPHQVAARNGKSNVNELRNITVTENNLATGGRDSKSTESEAVTKHAKPISTPEQKHQGTKSKLVLAKAGDSLDRAKTDLLALRMDHTNDLPFPVGCDVWWNLLSTDIGVSFQSGKVSKVYFDLTLRVVTYEVLSEQHGDEYDESITQLFRQEELAYAPGSSVLFSSSGVFSEDNSGLHHGEVLYCKTGPETSSPQFYYTLRISGGGSSSSQMLEDVPATNIKFKSV